MRRDINMENLREPELRFGETVKKNNQVIPIHPNRIRSDLVEEKENHTSRRTSMNRVSPKNLNYLEIVEKYVVGIWMRTKTTRVRTVNGPARNLWRCC